MMEFNTAEEWAKYIYENALLDSNKRININPERLNELIDLIPKKFIESSKLSELIQLNKDLTERDNQSLVEIWGMEDTFTLENSILAKFTRSKQQHITDALSAWLSEARSDFENIQGCVYEMSFIKSIDELELAKMELRELNKFFETGKCNSIAIHIDKRLFGNDFTEKELYEYYLSLLRGNYEFFITDEDYLRYEQELIKYRAVLTEAMLNPLKEQGSIFATIKPRENKQWQIAARIQALLWIKVYLENLIKTENFSMFTVNIPTVSIDDLVKKRAEKGFQLANSDRIIPVLYDSLTKKGCIKNEGLDSFKQAFENGVGTITWLTIQGQLGYFIQQLKNKGITLNNDNWKTASRIFIVNEKSVDINSLKSGASGLIEKHKNLIDNITSQILSIH